MCRPKHVEQLRNTGIINSTTRLHLVGSFYEILLKVSIVLLIRECVGFTGHVDGSGEAGVEDVKKFMPAEIGSLYG